MTGKFSPRTQGNSSTEEQPLRHAAYQRLEQRKREKDRKNRKKSTTSWKKWISSESSDSDISIRNRNKLSQSSSSLSRFWQGYSADLRELYENDPSKLKYAFFLRKLILYIALHFHWPVWYLLYVYNVTNILAWLSIVIILFTSLNYWYRYPYHAPLHRLIDQAAVMFSLILRHILMNQSFVNYDYWFYFTLYDALGVGGYICGIIYGPSYFSACTHLLLHVWAHLANAQLAYAYATDTTIL